ncbi:MAG: hypothetical protein K5840_07480 [Eubacterium sp.]|nr:hypothetical protein [Eubacterium sp.]
MSQEKVDRRKYEKANRAQIQARQKFKTRVAEILAGLLCAAIVVFIGFSIYDTASSTETSVTYTKVNIDAISNVEETLAADDTEE